VACAAGVAAVRADADIVCFLDGDGSDVPAFLGAIVSPIVRGEADFVMGSRLRGKREPGSMTPQQIVAGRVAGALMRLVWGVRFTDMSPFRAMRVGDLRRLRMTETTYGWNLEMQMRATAAGLRMLPVVTGALVASAISGKLISTSDRYKPYPIAGALLMATGLLLLSGLDQRSSDVLAGVYMLITGLGVGLVMQVVIMVAQNHAPREHIGVATSTATFSRAIGASIGVALFGAIFASRLASELASLGPAADRLAGAGARLDPQQVQDLPAAIKPDVIDALAGALQTTFLVGAAFALVALAGVLLLPRSLQPQTERSASVGGNLAARTAG